MGGLGPARCMAIFEFCLSCIGESGLPAIWPLGCSINAASGVTPGFPPPRPHSLRKELTAWISDDSLTSTSLFLTSCVEHVWLSPPTMPVTGHTQHVQAEEACCGPCVSLLSLLSFVLFSSSPSFWWGSHRSVVCSSSPIGQNREGV